MDPTLVKEIASKGGRVAHKKGVAHVFTHEEAVAAGRKGGSATGRQQRSTPSADRLSARQLEELKLLAKEPQNRRGRARARILNTLCRYGFASFINDEVCSITTAGRERLKRGR